MSGAFARRERIRRYDDFKLPDARLMKRKK